MKCLNISVFSVFIFTIFSQAQSPMKRQLLKGGEPCLRLHPKTNFHLYLLPNNYIQLGNVSLGIGHPNLPVLIKAYYDFALTRIQGASSEARNSCFQQLNRFIYKVITTIILPYRNELAAKSSNDPTDIHLWKLQTVLKYRLHEEFQEQYVPLMHYYGKGQTVQRACQIPKKIMPINIDEDTELFIFHQEPNLMESHSYAEKGCFSFFEQRVAKGTGYFKDSGIDISSPYFLSTNLLAFPDGTQMHVSEENLFPVLVAFYRCTMMEILAVSDPAARLCYTNLFNKNMQLFIVTLKKQYAVGGLDLLLSIVKEPKLPEAFGKLKPFRGNVLPAAEEPNLSEAFKVVKPYQGNVLPIAEEPNLSEAFRVVKQYRGNALPVVEEPKISKTFRELQPFQGNGLHVAEEPKLPKSNRKFHLYEGNGIHVVEEPKLTKSNRKFHLYEGNGIHVVEEPKQSEAFRELEPYRGNLQPVAEEPKIFVKYHNIIPDMVRNDAARLPVYHGHNSHVELDDNRDDTVNNSLEFKKSMKNSKLNSSDIWEVGEGTRYYIIMGICIILGLVFFFVFFLGFFITWLAYSNRITKMRQEQDRINYFSLDRAGRESDDPDETVELLNKT